MCFGKYLTLLFVFLLINLGNISYVFNKTFSIYNFFFMLIYLIFSMIILVAINKKKGWAYDLSSVFFVIYLIDIYYLYTYYSRNLSVIFLGFLAALGLYISVLSINNKKVKKIQKRQELPKKVPAKKTAVKTTFSPGKYIASKTGSVYHKPKCEWAKKIKKKNQVWFNSPAAAKKAGYKKHNCE